MTTANRGTSGLPVGGIVCRSSLPNQKRKQTFGSTTQQSGCVPLDIFGIGVASSNAQNYITGTVKDFEDMILNQDVVEGSVQGTLPWQLPAGKVAVVIGAGYRKEAAKVNATAYGTAAGYSGSNYSNFPSASFHNVLEGLRCGSGCAAPQGQLRQLAGLPGGGPHHRATPPPAWSRPGNWVLSARSMTTSSCALHLVGRHFAPLD